MQLLCPLCQSQLNIDDQYAGQLLKCTVCAGTFQAPTLPDVPMRAPPPPPPAPPPVMPAMELPPAGGPPPSTPAPPPPEPFTAAAPLPPPPSLDGYTHIYMLNFNQSVLSWFAVGGLVFILLLSFFPWSFPAEVSVPRKDGVRKVVLKDIPWENMWGAAFGEEGSALVMMYVIFYFLTLPVAVLALLLDYKVFTLPDPLKKVRPWRSVIVAGMAAVGFLFLFVQWAIYLFLAFDPNLIGFRLALIVQTLVMVGPLLEYWLQRRKKEDLPVPRIELRW